MIEEMPSTLVAYMKNRLVEQGINDPQPVKQVYPMTSVLRRAGYQVPTETLLREGCLLDDRSQQTAESFKDSDNTEDKP